MVEPEERCPECGAVLEQVSDGFCACSSSSCSYARKRSRPGGHDEPWNQALAADDENWHPPSLSSPQSVFSREYRRLRRLLAEGHVYGAMLQVRDIYEILIKFPVLSMACAILSGREYGGEHGRFLLALLHKPLSLGDWEQAAHAAGKQPSGDFPELVTLIAEVRELFVKSKIVEWRNDTIGHGAVPFVDDPVFQRELREKILLLRNHLESCSGRYRRLHLAIDESDTSAGEPVLCIGSETIASRPFFVEIERSCFFFDSYFGTGSKTRYLDYRRAEKRTLRDARLDEIARNLQVRRDQVSSRRTAIGKTYRAAEEKILQRLTDIDDYETPDHLYNWLSSQLRSHTRGVFLLTMERGMGKTTFAKSLDQHALSKWRQKGLAVRAHYVNDSYSHRPGVFLSNVMDQYRCDRHGTIALRGEFPVPRVDAEDPAASFERMLNDIRHTVETDTGQRRILLVIDGLDEIPARDDWNDEVHAAGRGRTIFDFLPEPGQLDEGVYVLLTCRTRQEIPDHTRGKLSAILCTAALNLTRRDPDYVDLLVSYIQSQQGKRLTEEAVPAVLEKADYRFLYVRLLHELLSGSSGERLDAIPPGRELIGAYLERLQSGYGEKFYRRWTTIAALIATAFDTLTVAEIAHLCGDGETNFPLLGCLADARCFLQVERSPRGNLIKIAHAEYQEELRRRFSENLNPLVRRWLDSAAREGAGGVEPGNDGETYVAAHLLEYARVYCREESTESLSASLARFSLEVGIAIASSKPLQHEERRALQLLEAAGSLAECASTASVEDEVRRLFYLGEILFHRGRVPEAEAAIARAEQLLSEMEGEEREILRAWLELEWGRVILFYRSPESQDRSRRALDTYRQLEKDDQGEILFLEMKATRLMALATRELGQAEKALESHLEQLRMAEELDERNHPRSREALSWAHNNLGWVYGSLRRLDDSAASYRRSLEVKRTLTGLRPHHFDFGVADTINGLAITLHRLGENDEAYAKFDESIAIWSSLYDSGYLRVQGRLATTIFNKVLALERDERFEEMLAQVDVVIRFREKLIQDGRLDLERFLANGLSARTRALCGLGRFEEAGEAIDRSLEIANRLLDQARLGARLCAIAAHRDKSLLLLATGRTREARQFANRAVQLWDERGTAGPADVDLRVGDVIRASALLARARVTRAMGIESSARKDCDEIFALRSTSFPSTQMDWYQGLARRLAEDMNG